MEDKRFQSVDNMVNVTVLIVLTSSQLQKLENKDLRPHIDVLAKDFHLDWAVETNGNVYQAALSRMCGPVVGSEIIHQIEIDATNFMGAVDKLELELDVINFDDTVPKSEIEFAKEVLETWDETEERCGTSGAILLCRSTHGYKYEMPCGKIKESTLKAMFEAFVEKYDHE